ncbi:hypothetical protein ARSEF4850_009596 [Beauveria asiatica]
MARHPKSWVLTTSQDFGPKGSLQLGQLLTDPYDPNSAVITSDLVPIPVNTLSDNQFHKHVDFASLDHEQLSFRTWLRSRNAIVPVEGHAGAANTNEVGARYRSSSVLAHQFPPNDKYAQNAVDVGRTEHRTKVEWWALYRKLWLVTGLRILADETVVGQWRAEVVGHHAAGNASVDPANIPLDGGLQAQHQHVTAQTQSIGGASSFIYAYRLHEVRKYRAPKPSRSGPWRGGELFSWGARGEEDNGDEPQPAASMGNQTDQHANEEYEFFEIVNVDEDPFEDDEGVNDELLVH